MNRSTILLFIVAAVVAPLFTSCVTFSEDTAPGGIRATDTGMTPQNVRDWQDRTIRSLAY